MRVFHFHTPDLVPTINEADCAVVIDVLRATTTIAHTLANGAEAVVTLRDVDEVFRQSSEWPADKRLLAGERGGVMVEGFDVGNSPLECTPERIQGKRIFLSTTNGTRALDTVKDTPLLLTAALVNRKAAVDFILEKLPDTVYLVGSGWEGAFSLEDSCCAGAILEMLSSSLGENVAANDEAVAAQALFRQYQNDLHGMLCAASHGRRLQRLGCHEDILYCAKIDSIDTVPVRTAPNTLTRLV